MSKKTVKSYGIVNGFAVWHDTSAGAMIGGGAWSAVPQDTREKTVYADSYKQLLALIDPNDRRLSLSPRP